MSTIRTIINVPKIALRRALAHPVRTGVATLVADQASKLAVNAFVPLATKPVDSLLTITNSINTAQETSAARFLAVTGMVSLAALFTKAKSKVSKLAFTLLIAGGLGNQADRLFADGVTDFIKVGPIPTFNLADVALTSASAILLYDCFFPQRNEASQENPSKLTILKNSFTKNILSTLGQTFVYAFTIWALTAHIGLLPTILPSLVLSLIRDQRAGGEGMF